MRDFPKIVITTDGKKTTATLFSTAMYDYEIASGMARCSPDDDFDFSIGAKLALERLVESYDPPLKKLKNGIFGKTEKSGYFVVVNDLLIYENGGFDYLYIFNDSLNAVSQTYPNKYLDRVTAIFDNGVKSFAQAKRAIATWSR